MVAHRPIVLRTGRRRKTTSSAKRRRRTEQEQRGNRPHTFDIREVRRRVYLPNYEDGTGGGGDGEFRVPSFDPRAIGGGVHRAATAEKDEAEVEEGAEAALRPPVSDHDPGMDKAEEPGGGADSTSRPPSPDDEAEAARPEQQEQQENVKEVQDGIRRYPWWVQLGVRKGDGGAAASGGNGGENTPFVMSANPETRRSHSAAILRLDTGSGPDESDGSPPSRQRDRRRRRDTEADGAGGVGGSSAEGEGDGDGEEPAPGVEVLPTPPGELDGSPDGEEKEGDGDDHDPAGDFGPDTTNPPPPPRSGHTPEEQERPVVASSSEYMIISGGFTDEDWSSFPVYAYDLSATHNSAAPTTTTPDPLSAAGEGNSPNTDDGPPPAGGWIRLGTGTSSELTKRQHEREHSSHGWGGGQKQRDPVGDVPTQEQPQPLWPPGRVGHVTAVSSRTGDLFVFGGMMYYDREFHAEDTPVVWRATGVTDGVRSASSSSAGWNDFGGGGGGRRHLQDDEGDAPPSGINATEQESGGGEEGSRGIKWTRIEARFDDPDPAYASSLLTRGEAAGGHWISSSDDEREYLVFYGGLHIKSRDDRYGGAGANTIRGGGANSGGYTFENLDVPLGDVWAFDMQDHTFTRLAGYPPEGVTAWDASRAVGTTYPIARTAHAATIDGDKLVIYGGMTMSADLGGWAATSSLPRWEMLDDVWAFDLVERRWLGRRDVYPGLARSYHSLVGRGDTLVACGGYRTAETIAGESIAFVFSDTLVSLPNTTRWYKAVSPTGSSEGLPHRLSHTSVLDSVGSTYVWGGRFRTVSQIAPSVWRLDLLHGDGSRATNAVALSPADPDGMDAYEAELQTLHLMVAVMIFMSVLFTTLYGTLRRGVEEGQHGGNNGVVNLLAGGGGGGNGGGRTTRRGGVRQDVIDSFPVKTFDASSAAAAAEETGEEDDAAGARSSRAGEGGDVDDDEEEVCCAICLLEYECGDEVRTLPCGHDFHRDCVDSWLWNNTSCPACRHSLSSVVPQSTSSSEGEEGADGDDDGDAGGGGRAARPSRWFVAGRMPVFLRRPVFSILSEEGEGEEERRHGDAATTPSARRGAVVVDDDPADRYVASDDVVVGAGGEQGEVERVRPIGGRLGASFGRHLRPSPPQARPVMMELVTYNVSSDDPYRL